jgi:hypothetical protein
MLLCIENKMSASTNRIRVWSDPLCAATGGTPRCATANTFVTQRAHAETRQCVPLRRVI